MLKISGGVRFLNYCRYHESNFTNYPFFNFSQEMEYNRRPKPFHQKKIKMRRKENKMQKAREQEFQLPSSNRGNRKDFFKELDDEENN